MRASRVLTPLRTPPYFLLSYLSMMKRFTTCLILCAVLCAGFASVAPAQEAPPRDSLAARADTLVTADTSRAAPSSEGQSVQVFSGTANQPTSLNRVRRRIAQIRGVDTAPRSPVVVPIIIVPGGGSAPAQSVVSGSGAGAPGQAASPTASTGTPSAAGLSQADLNQLENRIMRRLNSRLDELYYALRDDRPLGPAPNTVIAPDRAVPDTVAATPAVPPAVPETVLVRETVPAPAQGPPTVREIERAILETGLFRALGVNFEFNESTLLPEAENSLDAVGEVLTKYPDLRVEVAGHTDNIGSDSYNQQLSQSRAQSVRSYLLENFDIVQSRIVANGYGESRPIASNQTETGRALNRRVEFRLLNPEAAEQYIERTRPDTAAEGESLQEMIRRTIREEMGRPASPDTSGQQ